MEATGASHTIVIVVVPVEVTRTDLGGSGLGGAKSESQSSCSFNSTTFYLQMHEILSAASPNLQEHWKLPMVLVQSEVDMLQL